MYIPVEEMPLPYARRIPVSADPAASGFGLPASSRSSYRRNDATSRVTT